MSKRFLLCSVIGNGDGDAERPWNSSIGGYRAAVSLYTDTYRNIIAPNLETGAPLYNWCLTVASLEDWPSVLTDPRMRALPDMPLGVKLSAMSVQTMAELTAMLTEHSIPLTVLYGADGYDDVIEAIGRIQEPAFSLAEFDVAG